MEGLYQWAAAVSICAVVVCIVEMLLSDTALEKTVRLVLGLFLLSAVLLPIGNAVKDFGKEMEIPEYSEAVPDSTLSLEKQRKVCLERAAAELIDKKLKEKGIEPAKVEVHTDIDTEGCIECITAEVMLHRQDAHRSAAVSRQVREELGIECRTIIVE